MKTLGLFEGFGIELEYMIVERKTLNVLPMVDKLLTKAHGELVSELIKDNIAWSNELALHVIELKTNGPAPSLNGLAHHFQNDIDYINGLLEEFDAQLLPTGAHPWMNPDRELCLWPHEQNDVYDAYHAIFDCRGHGWANLQSGHLNLPFNGEDEFVRLHTAIRILLPLIPAIAASTPFLDGKLTGMMDARLEVYRHNQQKVPEVTGRVIPEFIDSFESYHERILAPMYKAIAHYDGSEVLQEEWLNSRGAIARFDRNAIEIRILDTQESPEADIAVMALVVEVLKALVDEKWSDFGMQSAWCHEPLASMFEAAIHKGSQAVFNEEGFLACFGWEVGPCTGQMLWQHLFDQLQDSLTPHKAALEVILQQGTLAERLVKAFQKEGDLVMLYNQVMDTLGKGGLFKVNR